MTDAIITARANQIACAEYIIDGGPDQRGARLGLNDWFAQEFLIEQERNDGRTREAIHSR